MNKNNKEHQKAVQNYRDYLTGACAQLEDAFIALQAKRLTPELHETAQVAAHKIAGNALMYGYGGLGDQSRKLENILKAGADFDPVQGQIQFFKLITKINDVCLSISLPTSTEFESENFQPDPNPDRWETDSKETEDIDAMRQKSSVLIIHSDSWIMNLMANMLEPEYSVIQCQFAHKAMALASNNSPELIILEQDLKDMSGLDVTKFFRNVDQLKSIPIIMVMSSDEPEDIVAAVEAGVTDCFENALEVMPLVRHARELLKKSQYKILVVDDDLAVRDLLKQRFETYGVRVDTASDGIEAIEYLRHKQPDLIILDRMMPRLEGGAVLYQIQQEINLRSIPVMLVTAMTNRDDVITWLQRGAIDYITKPFNPDEVVLRALRHLRVEKDAA